MNDLLNLSASEISVKIDEKEREFALALQAYHDVEQSKLLLQREILEKQAVKKDLEIALSKAGHNLKQMSIELKLMRSAFWKVKDGS
jgi:hypothetical protein